MSTKLRVLGAGAIFFLASQTITAQIKQSDSTKTKELEEVVLLGVTKKKTSEMVGNSVQLSNKDVSSPVNLSLDQALQGKAPGVMITTTSGTPGSQQSVIIRGVGSIGTSISPLYVIDGVPVVTGNVSGTKGSSLSTLASINVRDIESVTVLKDVSATALYGARGSNGVIVITTKSGRSGVTRFSLDTSIGFQNDAYIKRKALTGDQRYDLLKIAYANGNNLSIEDAEKEILDQNLGGVKNWIKANRHNVDWTEIVQNKNASLYNVDFSASGGDERGTFYASLGYNRTEHTVKVKGPFERVTGLLKVTRKLTDRLNFEGSVNGSWVSQYPIMENGANLNNPYALRFLGSPWANPYNPDGSYNLTSFEEMTSLNNYPYLVEKDLMNQNLLRGLVNTKVDYEILKDLVFATKVNLDYQSVIYKRYGNRHHGRYAPQGGNSEQNIANTYNWVIQNSLAYKFHFDKHRINLLAMYEYQKNQDYTLLGTGDKFPADDLMNLASVSTNKDVSSTYSNWINISYLGTFSYNYANKLILDASIRSEGSSVFAPHHRFGTFWSVGGAYNMHRDFLSDVFNELKLRASYGVTGNSGIGINQYQRLLTYGTEYEQNGAVYPSTLGNERLTWEKNKTFDAGIDFALFDRRLLGSFTYFNKYTYDLLLDVPISNTTGFESQTMNVGSMTNRGIEAMLNYDIFRNENFTWNISANIATVKNRVDELVRDAEGEPINPTVDMYKSTSLGRDYGYWFLPTWAGVNIQTGAPEWYKDGVSGEKTSEYAEAGKVYQGSVLPKYTGGLSTHMQYKNLFLDASIYFAGGNKVYDRYSQFYMRTNDFSLETYNGDQELLSAWQQPGDITNVPKLTYGLENSFQEPSSRFLYDGTFVRLKDITLGYELPSNYLSQIGINSIVVSVKATNLYTWAKDKGVKLDPETGSGGYLSLTTPPVKSIIFGINLKF